MDDIRDWLAARRSLLVIAHVRPDGDAFGSVFGAVQLLRENGRRVDGFVSSQPPARYDAFRPARLLIDRDLDPADYDGLLCLDCANAERLDLPPNWSWRRCGLPICNIDHHVDNGRYGQINYIDPECASTTQILARFAKRHQPDLTPATATNLLLGLVTDTGGFRFTNTQAETLKDAAWLIEQHADYPLIMDRIFFTEPAAKIKLQGRLLEQIHLEFDGRFAYAVLTDAMLDECEMPSRDTEGLIDGIRVIAGVDVCCLIQPIDRDVHLSLRARSAATPVIEIAHALGGGGHVMAAGATIKDATLEEAIDSLRSHVAKTLGA